MRRTWSRGQRQEESWTDAEPRYKRLFDLAVVTLTLLPLFPVWLVLVLAIALAVRLSSPGPVLYRQSRLGRGGRVFDILKFRTMAEDEEVRSGPVWAKWNDQRATPVGRVLRRFHLDELPQVVNVVRGEMSLVGPRPERSALAARIERKVPGFASRLRVRPGIAGLAQARGGYHIHPRDKLRYDLQYIEAMNPWLDLKLCARCAWKALRPGSGSCTAPPQPSPSGSAVRGRRFNADGNEAGS
jgi:lipopolysaccharide/colanic/teichoic acid biosynthesis glycosyltransferase